MRWLYPAQCPVCQQILPQNIFISEEEQQICSCCVQKLEYVKEPVCKKCGKPLEKQEQEYCYDCRRKTHSYDSGKAVFVYGADIRVSMYRFKYSNKRDYGKIYAREAFERYKDWIKRLNPDAILPIPLHKKRRKARGYNQAELIAAEISALCEVPMNITLLERIENTRPQKELNDQQRKNNLKNAFLVRENSLQLKKVLLIDDIYTTGSTMDEAARVLKAAGVEQVFCLCICIGRGY